MAVRDAQGIRERLQEMLEGRPEVCFAYLHGSFVEGVSYHDVDVAVYLQPGRHLDPFDYGMGLSVEMTLALGFPVDVQVLNDAPLGFQHTVSRGEALLVRDEAVLTAWIERIAVGYTEFAYLGRVYLREVTS